MALAEMRREVEQMFVNAHTLWRVDYRVCRQCGAVVSTLAMFTHWRWHISQDNILYQATVLLETVESLWGDNRGKTSDPR